MDILIIEDNPDDAFTVQRALRHAGPGRFECRCVATLAEGKAELGKGGVAAVLLDLSLPDSSGLDTVRQLRAADNQVAVIVLTGQRDDEVGLSAVKEGAQDYLVKGQIPPELLSRAIPYAIHRKETEEQLRAGLAEKEVLLYEIHHRVKNNLQVISSLLSLQADSLSSTEARQALQEAGDRVHAMASVHEKLYRQGDFAWLDFGDFLSELGASLHQLHAGEDHSAIRLEYELEPVSLGVNQAIPCALIVNELLVNAFKYAFPGDRRGTVWVTLRREGDDRATIAVSDDGVGLPADYDWRQATTLGMELVHSLGLQLRADVRVDPQDGTCFTFTFPIREKASARGRGNAPLPSTSQ